MHLIGASGHGKEILDTLRKCGVDVVGIWDDNKSLSQFMGMPILGGVDACKRAGVNPLIVAIGNNAIRKRIADEFDAKPLFGIAVHPSAVISRESRVDVGTVVMANATINAACTIGCHVIVNTNASVDHDCIIGNYAHISPQVGLAGNVKVGEGTQIGIGASVIQGINIGSWCTIGAGTVIIKDVPNGATVVGNPGRIIKMNS